ncbi:DNA replication/repair protein RecF [Dysgonomonas sp. 520]|uniref:DNA replication/repair protein RecF n=1 Tax=Dysgonomonas sp. 520 TaxID=2302931 RepID=UPI0013D8CCD5|nr:DNA replication and repair protein RecF [Dysgonomonas sp. 520]NDW09553.1 DNA replication and repair protein RecF [Dysgonomonas sp. 520]
MILERINILNYKNIEQAELTFSPKLNCFIGNNGMGKTNLLDAIYYLSFCKSHTNLVDSQNIKHDADFSLIQGWYSQQNGKTDEYLCSLKRRHKKIFKKNKKEYDKLSEHIGSLPLVLISPSDSDIIGGGSEERRRLMDVSISQFDKEYLHHLIKYNNCLQQRNALLRMEHAADETLFGLWEEQLAQEGLHIFEKRQQFINRLTPLFQRFYDYVCQSNEVVSLSYRSQLNQDDFMTVLKNKREKDRMLGYTSFGVHRDDLEMYLGDYPIKKVGSQGQNKTYLIALKLAQFDYLSHSEPIKPILLLDDIFDKLDTSRVKQIVQLVSGDDFGQIFITDTNREHLTDLLAVTDGNYKVFKAEQGSISEEIVNAQ